MKRIVEETEISGLEALLGEQVLLMCANYFYAGKLVGVNTSCVELSDAAIVYETGPWTEKGYKDSQKLSAKKWYVATAAIESCGVGK
jgi:hypothetical protein